MAVDGKQYREALKHYQAWNRAEMRSRLQSRETRTPEVCWRQFIELFEFFKELCPEESLAGQERKRDEMNRYYERLKKFEAWRKANGSAA